MARLSTAQNASRLEVLPKSRPVLSNLDARPCVRIRELYPMQYIPVTGIHPRELDDVA